MATRKLIKITVIQTQRLSKFRKKLSNNTFLSFIINFLYFRSPPLKKKKWKAPKKPKKAKNEDSPDLEDLALQLLKY